MRLVRHNPTGLNVQWPWSDLIVTGLKTVETRGYPLPSMLAGVPLALVETRNGPARVVAIVRFSHSVRYATRREWLADRRRHLVPPGDPLYGWTPGKPLYGWIVERVAPLRAPCPTDSRGIVYRNVPDSPCLKRVR
jgi:hypothetical protein